MKNKHIIVISALLITQTALAGPRASFRDDGFVAKTEKVEVPTGGVKGVKPVLAPTPIGNVKPIELGNPVADVKPYKDVLEKFNIALEAGRWEDVYNLKISLLKDYGYNVEKYDVKLSDQDKVIIEDYQAQFEKFYGNNDLKGAKVLAEKVNNIYFYSLKIPETKTEVADVKPYQGTLDSFNLAVKEANWTQAAELRDILQQKYNYTVSYVPTLTKTDYAAISKSQEEYNSLFFKDPKSASLVDAKVYDIYYQHLNAPTKTEVTAVSNETILTRGDTLTTKTELTAEPLQLETINTKTRAKHIDKFERFPASVEKAK